MKVLTSDWNSSKAQLMFVRRQVFIIELGVDERDEWDEQDECAVHFVAFGTTAVPIGVCRLTEDGQIGRLAVLPNYRQQGNGTLLLRKALQVAREMNLKDIYLHAMVDVQTFYHAHGFETDGRIFMEAGKPHVKMVRTL
ncbi:putative N-acetyltransferase YjcF [Marinomonas gallaica]|uniref:N-acetyltransferase YjcF n=1 Tax=Marinomonas gallaica TaxID=1806667 RepID=A0A1C3JR02_9GAMM|nr:GNAT family N-acetyltransferase [Marinomonas gallaica]SBT17537.1 putative N-acetyltransferase YjcF [Marinomonas gallaica]SBT19729.1 putative N-acetyltransferase YjcF [Marinomonas gallaica]